MNKETIFALASGPGKAGVAIIRISGPAAGEALRRLTGMALPAVQRMTRTRLRSPLDGALLDNGLVVWFAGPASYTGEDVAELHIHGGRAVSGAVLEALGTCPGLRLAVPGEFTRRAFQNGKLDLTAAEGLADLIDAETEAQRRLALRQLGGELGKLYDDWRERLVNNLAHLEAAIDFSDEDLPSGLLDRVRRDVRKLRREIGGHLNDNRRGERLRDGIHVAILGPPNAGKSSLLNVLAKRDAAIVSDTAGTTRDIVEVHLDLGGYPIVVADTAGLRRGGDPIEREGVRRALGRAGNVDIKVAVFDGAAWPNTDPSTVELVDENTIAVINKVDLKRPQPAQAIRGRAAHSMSVKTGEGVEELLALLESEVAERFDLSAAPSLTRARHRESLEECDGALGRFLKTGAVDLAAEDLRLAVRAVGRITGRVDVEDILDVVFQDFCIGK